MPELPEVETIRQGLLQTVSGAEITAVDVLWPRSVQDDGGIDHFKARMVGQTLETIERRGKYLFFYWSRDAWVAHLRMAGRWFVEASATPLETHCRVRFALSDGRDLRYIDVRKFGRIHCVTRAELPDAVKTLRLGPEPTDLDPVTFREKLQQTKRLIKPVLLDQHMVAGVGNIYCDEALWRAKIHPERPAASLSEDEVERLVAAIKAVIADAVAAGGTTIHTFHNAFGGDGHFQTQLNVYHKEGEACPRCGHTIEKIKVGQRGTHFCPYCQRLEGTR